MRTSLVAIATLIAALACAVLATAPPARAAATDMAATPTSLTGPTQVDATAGLPASGATNGAAQVLTQAFDPTYLRLGSAAQVTAPEGWTTTYSTDGTTFGPAPSTAADWATVRAVRTAGAASGTAATGGTESTSVAAPPSAAFSGGGGGDGWNVFFDNANHVFNIWHHNGSPWPGVGYGSIDCHTRAGASCGTGWPFALTNGGVSLQTAMHSPGWVDTARGHLWFPTTTTGVASGFGCVDVSNLGSGVGQGPAWCGGTAAQAFRTLGAGGPASFNDGDICSPAYRWGCVEGLAVAGSRIHTTETRTGKVLCLDMAAAGGAGAACAGQPYDLNPQGSPSGVNAVPWQRALAGGNGIWLPALLNANGLIVGTARASYTSSTSAVLLFCLVGATGAPCPGWSPNPKTIGDPSDGAKTPWLTYAEPDASGAIIGVCVRPVTQTTVDTPSCVTLGGATMTGNAAIASNVRQATGSENGTGATFTVGSRVYWGNGTYNVGESRLYCSDAATSQPCTGWPVDPATGGGARQGNYVMGVDPANDDCLWVNSDASGIYQYNSGGTRGCASTPPGSATFTATNLVAPQRVSCTGPPAWGSLALTSPVQGTYAAATLTVLDASGQVVVSGGQAWRNVPLAADGTLDLGALSQADTGSNPQFVVNLTGRTGPSPFAPIATTLTAQSYAPQLCTALTAQEIACPIVGAPANSLLAWTSPITAGGSQGGTPLDPTDAGVDFANAATAACAPPPPPPPPAPSPPAPSTPATETAITPPAPRTGPPATSPSGTAVLTSVSVGAPGVVTQRGTRASGGTGCTSRPVMASAPGSVTVVCLITPATLARLATAPVRLRLVTTLRATSGGTSQSVRYVLLRRRSAPVTG